MPSKQSLPKKTRAQWYRPAPKAPSRAEDHAPSASTTNVMSSKFSPRNAASAATQRVTAGRDNRKMPDPTRSNTLANRSENAPSRIVALTRLARRLSRISPRRRRAVIARLDLSQSVLEELVQRAPAQEFRRGPTCGSQSTEAGSDTDLADLLSDSDDTSDDEIDESAKRDQSRASRTNPASSLHDQPRTPKRNSAEYEREVTFAPYVRVRLVEAES